ncbi:MAG: hypothetical protein ACLFQK_09490, partial [Fibrobacterota bacterium]
DQDRLVVMPLDSEEYTPLLAYRFFLEIGASNEESPFKRTVVNMSTTAAWEDVSEEFKAKVLRAPVGEINVAEKMIREKIMFGAEGNGGIILGNVTHCRNSEVGILLFLMYLAWSGKALDQLQGTLPSYSVRKEKFPVPSGLSSKEALTVLISKELSESQEYNVLSSNTEDGLKVVLEGGCALHVRFSNTEPVFRVIAEKKISEDSGNADDYLKSLFIFVKKASGIV